ncbi:hypothetical protein HPB47_022780, partial [Ixodes persulcatus]
RGPRKLSTTATAAAWPRLAGAGTAAADQGGQVGEWPCGQQHLLRLLRLLRGVLASAPCATAGSEKSKAPQKGSLLPDAADRSAPSRRCRSTPCCRTLHSPFRPRSPLGGHRSIRKLQRRLEDADSPGASRDYFAPGVNVNGVYESGEERESARNNGEQDAPSPESRRAKRRNGYGYGLLGIADVVS